MSSKEAEKAAEQAAPAAEQLHPAPSMLWMMIPLALIAFYAIFSR
jgi:hypothetical protein